MRPPPKPILLGAKRWLEILPSAGGIPRAQALLTTHTQYSDLTPTQYQAALAWIREVDLLDTADSVIPPAGRVLGAIFEKAPPPWFRDADELIHSPDELPSDIISAGEALGIDQNGVYEHLVSCWSKVDTALREEVGAAGEEKLVKLLEECPDGRVDHVSKISDGFGYDISFSYRQAESHLEVKSTTRRGRFTAYLSRHEYGVMLRDASWVLVTVRLTAAYEIAGVGSVPREWIAANVPEDTGHFGRWATVKLEVPESEITNGVPRLGPDIVALLPTW